MTGEGKIMVKKVLGREGESYPVCSVLHFISASSMREKQTSAIMSTVERENIMFPLLMFVYNM